MTPHNEARKEDIAKIVVMPGDPLRAKYIAEKYLTNYKLVNSVRGIYAYTGEYKGKRITVMAHGMGIASMGIYAYELYRFYDVDCIIRIGSCGSYSKDLKLFDVVLSEKCFSESNFALSLNDDDCHIVESNKELNDIIKQTAKEKNVKLYSGNTVCSECFDPYITDLNKYFARIPENFNALTSEMEAFPLFYLAKMYNKKASCLMTIVDSIYIKEVATPQQRQTGLTNMIELALYNTLKL